MTGVYRNILGTTNPSFKIGKGGATIHQGASEPAGMADGDVWLDTASGSIKFRTGGSTEATKTEISDVNGLQTALDVKLDTSGNAATASALATPRDITLGGDLSGSGSFDGSENITITGVVADDSHNHVISNVDGLQTSLDSKEGTLNVDQKRKITYGTAAPSGGSNGDIYIQYEN